MAGLIERNYLADCEFLLLVATVDVAGQFSSRPDSSRNTKLNRFLAFIKFVFIKIPLSRSMLLLET